MVIYKAARIRGTQVHHKCGHARWAAFAVGATPEQDVLFHLYTHPSAEVAGAVNNRERRLAPFESR
jgi:hypothetical protein